MFALCGMLGYDIYVHKSSPAYAAYVDLCRDLTVRQDDFERRVKSDFVPAVILAITNRPVVSVSSFASSSSPSSVVSRVLSSPLVGARYFVSDGFPYFEWAGHVFAVGDDLLGSDIVSIRPTVCVLASGHVFSLVPANMEVMKNDS